MSTTYALEHALVEGVVRDGVLVTVEDGVITDVVEDSTSSGAEVNPSGAQVGGLTIPGMANCHSHAFHRRLRGRTQAERGSFWTWREQMYRVADELTPDSYYSLAVEVYREMRASGITAVGEFHYLHHQSDGTPYDDPNEMGRALLAAASARRKAGPVSVNRIEVAPGKAWQNLEKRT